MVDDIEAMYGVVVSTIPVGGDAPDRAGDAPDPTGARV
jgi:hypothetical protein